MTSFENLKPESLLLSDCLYQLNNLDVLLSCIEAILSEDFSFELSQEDLISSSIYLISLYKQQMVEVVLDIEQAFEMSTERLRRS